MTHKWLLIPMLALGITLVAAGSQADTTRKHKITSQSFGAYEATTANYYTADRSAEESLTRWTRGLMKTMTGGKEAASGNITRLDKEVVWSLDPKKKTYTEMTFAQYREMLQKGLGETEESKEEKDTLQKPEDQYTWTVEAKSDPQEKTINGFKCRNVRVVATGVNKTDPQDKVFITFDLWNSPDVPGADEIRAFSERYMKALGLDESALTPGLLSAGFMYQKQLAGLAEEMRKAPGEPVLSTIEIKRHQLAGPNLGKAAGEAVKNEVLGKLPFGLKKKEAPKSEEPQYVEKIKFSLVSELNEATTATVEAAKFEIPEGFKKVENK